MRSAVIVGTGLIGTSIGLSLRGRGIETYLTDVSSVAQRTAEALGAGVAAEPPDTVDLAVIAVPPSQVAEVTALHQLRGTARYYTDVATVKTSLRHELKELADDLTVVVGSHPLVEPPGSGPLAARKDLFDGRPWALVPDAETAEPALNCALELVAACGATPVVLDAESHDRAVALSTFLPSVISSLASARLTEADTTTLRLLGESWPGIRRLVGSGVSESWVQALMINAGPVAEELEKLGRNLTELIQALRIIRSGSHTSPEAAERLAEFIRLGTLGGSRVPGKYGVAEDTALADIDVLVEGRRPELARLFDHVTGAGVSMRGIDISQRPDGSSTTVTISVPSGDAASLLHELRRRNWPAQVGH